MGYIKAQCGCGPIELFDSIDAMEAAGKCKSCKQSYSPIPESVSQAAEMSAIERAVAQTRIKNLLAKTEDQSDRNMLNRALGFMALANGSQMLAKDFFAKVIEEDPTDPESYYYYCLSALNGKRPFLQTRSIIDDLLDKLNFSIACEAKGKYYYLQAVLVADFYDAKFMRCKSKTTGERMDSRELLETARELDVTREEESEIYKFLNMTSRPKGF